VFACSRAVIGAIQKLLSNNKLGPVVGWPVAQKSVQIKCMSKVRAPLWLCVPLVRFEVFRVAWGAHDPLECMRASLRQQAGSLIS